MRSLVITAPFRAEVAEVPDPVPGEGQVVVEVSHAGVCGTDLEIFSGQLPYFADGTASFPIRIGHEWCGHVVDAGSGVNPDWHGAFVTGDTQIGCGTCRHCRRGQHNICADRCEIGIRGGWHGALADRLLVPEPALFRLPAGLPPPAAAFAEPSGTAVRAVAVADVEAGQRVCVWGPGTIGLLVLQAARARGAIVDVVGTRPEQLDLARRLGAHRTYTPDTAPDGEHLVVVDATGAAGVPARTITQVDAGGVVVLIGVPGSAALSDARDVVLKDLRVIGILAGSAGLGSAIDLIAGGEITPEPLIGEVIRLDDVPRYLLDKGATYPSGATKTLVNLRLG
ncbi:putative alcohol dehydrogenase [Actinoplanes missouriensis 431]|uniref:Putative alcohol dehydrogenase n=1 Tax=Actinoplanes missouriensis (strain ATCC 14538 / DSM 43046 / CBS 188.64 / JCM 3121 / NBRC 102363 / NCIMB 12654 / NRRL B-3342 / UNCC 431) TaxID=512565 RepID=I0H436_ACTM4|nr:alcohol dehydrogenase catalytic domain-containing protein [Actinoplanes missouriensis]BAL87773.1 putative alcohol dehydrogenase [Actinoplanes missouriensis 431]